MRLRARGLGAGRFPGRRAAQRQFPNARLLEQALRNIKPGDILLAHLGIWSRQDPWPAVLEPLVEGLQRKGYCFATLDTHPAYKGWIATHH